MGPPAPRVIAMMSVPRHDLQSHPMLQRSGPPRDQRFFCPRNKQLLDDELPSVDMVRRVRSVFEARAPPRRVWTDTGSVSSGVSSADLSSNTGGKSDSSDFEEDDNEDSYLEPPASPPRYVPDTVLERIRSRGTSVTYYGGHVVAKSVRPTSPTRAILTEIQRSTEYQAWLNPGSGQPKTDFTKLRKLSTGRCRLIKSNSCDSRLEIMALQPKVPLDNSQEQKDEQARNESRKDRQQQLSCHWPGKTSILFDFRKHPSVITNYESHPARARRHKTLSGAIASAHALLAAASTTTL